MRGLFSIIVLEKLMEEVRKIDAPDKEDALKPCNYFDLICGTSTGGLLALMLGRLRMDVHDCKEVYKSLSSQVFKKPKLRFPGKMALDAIRGKAWFSGERLESNIQKIVKQHISKSEEEQLKEQGIKIEDAPLATTNNNNSRCFVCALVEGGHGCDRLRSYAVSAGAGGPFCTIWQAARATSAAPLYFPPITINCRKYFDGGMHSNNPILEVVKEAIRPDEGHRFDAIVSIDCGLSKLVNPSGGLVHVAKGLVSHVTDTEVRHKEFQRDYPHLKEVYSRFQETTKLGSIGLADYDKLQDIEDLAEDFIKAGIEEIRQCARRIQRWVANRPKF